MLGPCVPAVPVLKVSTLLKRSRWAESTAAKFKDAIRLCARNYYNLSGADMGDKASTGKSIAAPPPSRTISKKSKAVGVGFDMGAASKINFTMGDSSDED